MQQRQSGLIPELYEQLRSGLATPMEYIPRRNEAGSGMDPRELQAIVDGINATERRRVRQQFTPKQEQRFLTAVSKGLTVHRRQQRLKRKREREEERRERQTVSLDEARRQVDEARRRHQLYQRLLRSVRALQPEALATSLDGLERTRAECEELVSKLMRKVAKGKGKRASAALKKRRVETDERRAALAKPVVTPDELLALVAAAAEDE